MKKIISVIIISITLTSCVVKLTADEKMILKNELGEMVKVDQVAAYIPQGKYKGYSQTEWDKFKDSVFSGDKIRIESMFSKYGFLGFDKVGRDGSDNFWLLVQHCDKFPEFQKKILKAMDKNVKRNNASPNNYAYLYDRVQVNAGQKQKFGTQVTYEVRTTGRAILKNGLIDSLNVDKIRSKYKLEPLKKYLNMMTAQHYEMNKEHYQKMGITKPDIYE
jgi:hypothetical protein